MEQFLNCKEAIIAGRVECYEMKQFLDGKFCSMDVASLYPFVMMFFEKAKYGTGNIIQIPFTESQ
jgi:hypothetical protein